jgi:hypothetical protein
MILGTLIVLGLIAQAPDGERLSTADLAAYGRALIDTPATAEPVDFRALWEEGDRYRGQRVEVRGRVVRRLAQPAFGDFPPLTEAWLLTPGDNPICLVYPTSVGEAAAGRPGDAVRFVGTYLRRVRYDGGDGPRLAPLLVGPRAPELAPASRPVPRPGSVTLPAWLYWSAALVVAASMAGVMAWLALRRAGPSFPGSSGVVEFRRDGENGEA